MPLYTRLVHSARLNRPIANPSSLPRRLRDVPNRLRGAFEFPASYGHYPSPHRPDGRISFNLDIGGGAVASLCEMDRAATQFSEHGHCVNLLFDHETDAIRVRSPYTNGAFQITLKQPGVLHVRIPSWVTREHLTLPGTGKPWEFDGDFLRIAAPPVNTPITIRFPLPTEDIVLRHSTRTIRCRLRGDEMVAMENFGMPLTLFPELE